MQPALSHQASWVTITIFALAGGISGMLAGGLLPAAVGFCLGLAFGSLAGPSITQFGYFVSVAALLYAVTTCYTSAGLTTFANTQTSIVRQTLPPGSTFDRVYTYLKTRHARNITMGHSAQSMLTADYEMRFLLSSVRFHGKFAFDKHERLTHCSIRTL